MWLTDWIRALFLREADGIIKLLKLRIKELNETIEGLDEANNIKVTLIDELYEEIDAAEKEILRLKQPKKRYVPIKIKELSQSDVRKILNFRFKGLIFNWNDARYRTVSISEFMKILKEDKTNNLKYISETFDCENFAAIFKNRLALYYGITAVGVVLNYKGGHAFNVVVCSDGVYVLEPQTDAIWGARENDKKGKFYQIDDSVIGI